MGFLWAITTFILIPLLLLKVFLKLTGGWDRSPTCLVGKTAIVTGANTGIGFCTAQDFAKRGARVILACRDKSRAEEAKTKIIDATGNPDVLVKIVDFASLGSVRAFAKDINATEGRLDILVNNAGVGAGLVGTTNDGLNSLMQINYFGPFLLTLLLIDLLKKSAPSRIVNVTSALAHVANLNTKNLNAFPEGRFAKNVNYGNSKLCNILFTNELARKLQGTGVTTNAAHPGLVRTEIFRYSHNLEKMLIQVSSPTVMKSAEEGAQTSIYLAVSKDVKDVSGEYFVDCRVDWLPGMPKVARDENLCKDVWKNSEEIVKLTAGERQL